MLNAVTFDFIETLMHGHSRNDLFLALGKIATQDEHLRPVLLAAASAYGPMRREDIRALRQSTLSDLIAKVAQEKGAEISNDELQALNDRVFAAATSNAKLFDDVVPSLTALTERHLTLGLVTNVSFPGSYYDKLLESLGIAHYFSAVVWSSDAGVRKPAPKIFLQTLDEMRVAPDETIHVGDMPNRDVRGAHDAGMRAVWLNRTGIELQPDEEQPDWAIRELGALSAIVDQERT